MTGQTDTKDPPAAAPATTAAARYLDRWEDQLTLLATGRPPAPPPAR